MFYGARDFRPDGSYITTKWVVLFFLPLFPLCSMRLRFDGMDAPTRNGLAWLYTTNYQVCETTRPNLKQVISVYGFVIFMITWLVLVFMGLHERVVRGMDTTTAGIIGFVSFIVPTIGALLWGSRRQGTSFRELITRWLKGG